MAAHLETPRYTRAIRVIIIFHDGSNTGKGMLLPPFTVVRVVESVVFAPALTICVRRILFVVSVAARTAAARADRGRVVRLRTNVVRVVAQFIP